MPTIAIAKASFLLRVEGAAVLLAACMFYQQLHGNWLWFGLLFLTPDFSMLGYLANQQLGAAVYNFVHTYAAPLFLLLLLWLGGRKSEVWLILIWLAHIGLDRMIGYGLKYETAFKDTHLQRT